MPVHEIFSARRAGGAAGRRLADETGMSMVFVSVGFMAFFAATTLAIDVGLFMTARTQAQTPGEIRVEYDADDQAGGLQVGAKLRHPSFGIGEVRAWQGAGNDMKVTMRFPGVGVKTILARFLTRP